MRGIPAARGLRSGRGRRCRRSAVRGGVAVRGQGAQQGQAVGGEGRGDPGQVQHPPGVHGLRRDGWAGGTWRRRRIRRGSRALRTAPQGGGGAGHGTDGRAAPDAAGSGTPGVRGGGGAFAVGAEVDTGGPPGIALDGGGVHPVSGDGADQMVAEAVRADPAHPAGAVPGAGEGAGDVRLGAADRAVEGGHVGERAGAGGQERDHGLAQADDVDVGGGGHDGICSSLRGLAGRPGRCGRGCAGGAVRPSAPLTGCSAGC